MKCDVTKNDILVDHFTENMCKSEHDKGFEIGI